MANYTKLNAGTENRTELHDVPGLTSAEVSINRLPARAGKAEIGEEAVPLTAGDWLKVAPAARRRFSAAADTGLTYICIQTGENSLGGFTAEDVIWCRIQKAGRCRTSLQERTAILPGRIQRRRSREAAPSFCRIIRCFTALFSKGSFLPCGKLP